jgi:branched-chain amino acid transport system ATP-binding protein
MTIASNIIRSEHCEIECVLKGFSRLAYNLESNFHRVDSNLLWLLLDWIEAFPPTFHHPKEEDHLFPAIVARCPEAAGLVEQLIHEHTQGIDLMTELRNALEAGPDGAFSGQAFCDAAMRYVALEQAHVRLEEDRLLPLASQVLSHDDWARINRAFLSDANPLIASHRRKQFNTLFVKILRDLSEGIAA